MNQIPYFPRVLVIGRDNNYNNLLKRILAKIGITKVTSVNNYALAWSEIEKWQPDICIVDANTEHNTAGCIDFFDDFQRKNGVVPMIIITGSLDNETYGQLRRLHPSCIVNKQLTDLQVQHALDLAISGHQLLNETLNSPPKPTQNVIASHFFLKIGDIYKAIKISEIAFFYAENKMTYARVEARNFPTSVQLKNLAARLNPYFLRCHKKYLINVSFIDSLATKEGKLKIGEEFIPIGYAYRKSFLSGLNLLK